MSQSLPERAVHLSGRSVAPRMAAECLTLRATPGVLSGFSGQDSFVLDDSGGEEICSVAVPYVIDRGAAAVDLPARK